MNITPIIYISIDIDIKTYNRIIRFITIGVGKSDIKVSKFFDKSLQRPNEFARLKCGKYYMDVKIKNFAPINNVIIITFYNLIDTNKRTVIDRYSRYKKAKQKKGDS